jgi:hypothetical protein
MSAEMPKMRVFGGLPPDAEAAWDEMDKRFDPDDPILVERRRQMEAVWDQERQEEHRRTLRGQPPLVQRRKAQWVPADKDE